MSVHHAARHVARYFFLSIIGLAVIFAATMYLQIQGRAETTKQLKKVQKDYDTLKKVDQKIRNDRLEEEVKSIQTTYKDAVSVYENLLKLREKTAKISDLESEFALNLNSGGSTALWSGGRYLVGPGRNTPFGILLVSK